MFDFGDDLIIESYRIPWLIWIQLLVMLLLVILLYSLSNSPSDPSIYSAAAIPSTPSAANRPFLATSTLHHSKVIGSRSENVAPVFRNLTRLELGRDSCRDWSVVIKMLLESTDNLERLVMKGSSCDGSHESWWTGPLSVPMCLLQRVTAISFTAMGDCSDELELVAYFLKNAEVLELLTVASFGGSEAKLKLMQKISMIPRGSQACQVAFK